jgi:ABC-2 type transport system permease protein
MKGSVVRHLILKDWRLYRLQMVLSIAGGATALAILQWRGGGEGAMTAGSVWFYVALILLGTMLPLLGIVNERKKQNLVFVMSLPISSIQYTTAKLLSTVGMFLVPWLTLVISGLVLVETRAVLPHGSIPMILILDALPFVGLCIITGTTLVGESEGWGIAATVICNSSYGLVFYFLNRIPALTANAKGPAPDWNSTVLTVLGVEFGSIALILALTFYLQSRKRDLV